MTERRRESDRVLDIILDRLDSIAEKTENLPVIAMRVDNNARWIEEKGEPALVEISTIKKNLEMAHTRNKAMNKGITIGVGLSGFGIGSAGVAYGKSLLAIIASAFAR